MTNTKDQLMRAAVLVRPALAKGNHLPILNHIRFDGGFATSCDAITAIMVKADADLGACVPGELLIKALGSFSGDVAIKKDKGNLVVSSATSKLKIPTLPPDDHPFVLPGLESSVKINIDGDMLIGMNKCLSTVGDDAAHQNRLGLNLEDGGDGKTVIYSTDGYTMSRYETGSRHSVGRIVFLPAFLCSQLVGLAKEFPEVEITMHLTDEAIVVEFGEDAKLITKSMGVNPLEMGKGFANNCDLVRVKRSSRNIPVGWDSALQRNVLVQTSTERSMIIDINDASITLNAVGNGSACDSLEFEVLDFQEDKIGINPDYLIRASKMTTQMYFGERAMALSDADFKYVNLVAYRRVT